MSCARVIIAGTGIAASVLACELRKRGRPVVLLERRARARPPLIEALPSDAVRALASLGHEDALRRAGACVGPGFIDALSASAAIEQSHWVTYVERHALAEQLYAAALRCGASRVVIEHLPTPATFADRRSDDFFVDATGRAARWSGEIARTPARVATLFCGPGARTPRPGRIVAYAQDYAYALFHRGCSTIGVVGKRPAPWRLLPADLAHALEVDARAYGFVARGPAQAQWAKQPISISSAAVGDAAFAHEPIAGQGVRFAISSACILAGVIDGEANAEARAFYRELVNGARKRHLTSLPWARAQPLEAAVEPGAAELLRFDGSVAEGTVFAEGRVQRQPVVQLTDARQLRFLGALDLLALRARLATPLSVAQLTEWLQSCGWAEPRARRALSVCLQLGILGRVEPHEH